MRLKALELTPLDRVKVVILGQDPYHGPGQAMGLELFGATGRKGAAQPGEHLQGAEADLPFARPAHGDLSPWARQGVLLLNNALTVEAAWSGAMRSAAGRQSPTPVSQRRRAQRPQRFHPVGQPCAGEGGRIEHLRAGRHCASSKARTQPAIGASRFFGSRPFSRANAFLERMDARAIDWSL